MQRRSTLGGMAFVCLVLAAMVVLFGGKPVVAADEPFDVIVTAGSSHVMAGEKSIGDVAKGTRLTVRQTNGDWYLTDVPNANPPQQGWIRKDDVQTTTAIAASAQPPSKAPHVKALEPDGLFTPRQFDRLGERNKFQEQKRDLLRQGKFTEAVAAGEKVVAIDREVLGADHCDTFLALAALIKNQALADDMAAAQKSLAELAGLQTKGYGAGSWRAVNVRLSTEFVKRVAGLDAKQRERLRQADQANMLMDKQLEDGKYKEGLVSANQALDIRKELLGPESPDALSSEIYVGWFERQLGKYKEAETVLQDVLEKRRKLFGETHPDVGMCNNALGNAYLEQRDFKSAEPCFRRAAEIYLNAEGNLSENYASCLDNLGALYVSTGEFRRAEALRSQVVEIRKKILNRGDAWYARTLWNLAIVEEDLGKFDKAQSALLEALGIYKQKWGDDHITSINCANELAYCYEQAGQLDQSMLLRAQLLEIRRRVLGPEHADVGLTLHQIGSIHLSKKNYLKALEFERQAAEVYRKGLGEKDARFTTALSNVGWLLGSSGFECQQRDDFTGARKAFQEEMEIEIRLDGAKNWKVTDLRLSLANVDRLEKMTPADRTELIEARQLSDKADDLKDTHLRDAVAPAEKALEIRQRLLGEEHYDTLSSLAQVGFIYREMGDYAKARPITVRLPELCRKVEGELHPDYCSALYNLASMYKNQGDLSKAEANYQQALELYRKVFGEENNYVANTLNSLAQIDRATGRLGQAESLFREALEIRKATVGQQDPRYADSLLTLGGFYMWSLEDYAKAEPLLLEAVDIYKSALGVKHPSYARGIDYLASLYVNTRHFDRAEPLYLESLAIRKQCLGENHRDCAESMHNLAVLYERSGDYAKAEPLMLQSLKISEQIHGRNYPDNTISMAMLADIYIHLGQYAKSETMNREALEVRRATLGEYSTDYAESLSQSARLAGLMGHPESGVPLAAQAVAIGKADLERNASFQSERQQLAVLLKDWGLIDEYLDISAKASAPVDPIYAQVLDWKGIVGARQQQLRRLHRQLQQSDDKEVVRIENELQAATRSLAEISQSKSGQTSELRFREQEFSDKIESLQQQLAKESVEFRTQMELKKIAPDDIRRVLPAGVALVDFLSYQQLVPPKEAGGAPTYQTALTAFVVRADQPVTRVELGPANPIDDAIQQWRASFGRKSDDDDPASTLRELIWQPLEKFIGHAETVLISPNGLTARMAWAALPGARAGTFLIDDVSIAVVPIPRLLPQMLAVNKSAANSVASREPAKVPSLLLVGDVDFGADPGSGGLLAMDTAAARGGGQYNWPSLPGTRDEVAAIQSSFVKQFQNDQPTMLARGAATKSAVAAAMVRCEYIHLSTHGFFAPPETPSAAAPNDGSRGAQQTGFVTSQTVSGYQPGLLSGLVLAGANRHSVIGKDDGILTALEVEEMDLHNVQLATLSACETGLGKSAGGEGLLGLQRAFQTAGAKTVVASLWQVPDKATQLLMSRFYDNLWHKRMSKIESLREAQRWLLREASKQPDIVRGLELPPGPEQEASQSGRLSPRYWAAFELSGDWR